MCICHISFVIACGKSPGVISDKNVHCFMYQPYDRLMFVENKACHTCRTPKPARSKHCDMCGFCVPSFDHHCIWLNQCIGELNYRYFLSFLAIHSAFFTYAAYGTFSVIVSEVYENNLFSKTFVNSKTGQEFKATWGMVFRYVAMKQLPMTMLFILALVMACAIFGFLCYHLYLVSIGLTTNESFKWSSVASFHKRMSTAYAKYCKAGFQPKSLPEIRSEADDVVEGSKMRVEERENSDDYVHVDAPKLREGESKLDHAVDKIATESVANLADSVPSDSVTSDDSPEGAPMNTISTTTSSHLPLDVINYTPPPGFVPCHSVPISTMQRIVDELEKRRKPKEELVPDMIEW